MKGNRFKKEEKMRAIEAYMSGKSLEESAVIVGASPQSVSMWIKKYGFNVRGLKESHNLAVSKGKGKFYGELKYAEISELYMSGLSSQKVSDILGIPHSMVQAVVRRNGIVREMSKAVSLISREISNRTRKYCVNEDIFEGDLSPESAWALGVIYGDGWVMRSSKRSTSHGVGISGDKDVVEKVVSIMGSSHPVKQREGCYVAVICSKKLADSIKRWGVVPCKSRKISWPKNLPVDLEPHFLRGIFDADGWVSGFRGVMGIGMVSNDLVEAIADRMLNYCGRRPKVSIYRAKKNTHSDFFSVILHRKRAIAFGQWLWGNSSENIRGKRKYNEFRLLSALDPI